MINKTTDKEKEFGKNIFKSGTDLYKEKGNVPTPEEKKIIDIEEAKQSVIDQKNEEIADEAEYLGELNNL